MHGLRQQKASTELAAVVAFHLVSFPPGLFHYWNENVLRGALVTMIISQPREWQKERAFSLWLPRWEKGQTPFLIFLSIARAVSHSQYISRAEEWENVTSRRLDCAACHSFCGMREGALSLEIAHFLHLEISNTGEELMNAECRNRTILKVLSEHAKTADLVIIFDLLTLLFIFLIR